MTTTLNNSYQSNPLTVAQGGTGLSSITAYGLIAAGTTSTSNFQNLGAGSTNSLLVSGGSAAPGSQTNGNATGTWQLISSQVASTSASINFTGLNTNYEIYKLIINNIIPATAGDHLWIRISTDNGATYKSGTTDYFYANRRLTQGGTAVNANGNISAIQLDQGGLSTNNFSSQFEITFVEPDVSNTGNGCFYLGQHYDNTTAGFVTILGEGYYGTAAAINAFQALCSTGNISSGIFKLYGILV